MSSEDIRILSEDESSPTPIAVRLAQTMQWCGAGSLADPRGSLRRLPDPDLRRTRHPSYDGTLSFRPADAVAAVCRDRAERVDPSDASVDVTDPALMIYSPDEDLFDGAAELETSGFFDVNNTPPWDTWIAFVEAPEGHADRQGVLISYVPDDFVELVGRGMWANPEECIKWLSDDFRAALDLDLPRRHSRLRRRARRPQR